MPDPTRPTAQPRWASGMAAIIAEPPSGKKDQGWIAEKPPFAYDNWFYNLVYQWLLWLDFITYSPNLQVTKTTTATISFPTRTVFGDVSGAGFTATLDLAANFPKGHRVTFKNISVGSGNTLTVAPGSGDKLEGTTSNDSLAAGDNRTYETDGVADWWDIGS